MAAESAEEMETRVRGSFGRQPVMTAIGAALVSVEQGAVVLEMPYREDLTQQHGFLHAGIVSTVLDSACGYAAFSCMPPTAAVLTVEFKVNLMAPAIGSLLRATGRVIRAGRTITVCAGTGEMVTADGLVNVAQMQATIMSLPSTEQISH